MRRYRRGDWVVTNPVPLPHPRRGTPGGTGYKPDYVFEVGNTKKIDEYPQCLFPKNVVYGIFEDNVRPATEEEIRTGKVIITKTYELWL